MRTLNSTMLRGVSHNRKTKTGTFVFKNGATYEVDDISRYRVDAVAQGKVKASSGKSAWHYVLGLFNFRRIK